MRSRAATRTVAPQLQAPVALLGDQAPQLPRHPVCCARLFLPLRELRDWSQGSGRGDSMAKRSHMRLHTLHIAHEGVRTFGPGVKPRAMRSVYGGSQIAQPACFASTQSNKQPVTLTFTESEKAIPVGRTSIRQ